MLRWAFPVLCVLVLAALPLTGNDVLVQYGIDALLFATLAQAWNILGGFTGYVSFGNSSFYGLGTYGTAIAMAQFHWPFGVGLALGALLAVACAVLFGIPILRLRGHYFAIATLGLSATLAAIIANLDISGKNIGLILPLTRADNAFYEEALILLIAATATVAWIARSRFGTALLAIREDEDAALVMGINTTRYKIAARALCVLHQHRRGHSRLLDHLRGPCGVVRSDAQRAHGDHGNVRWPGYNLWPLDRRFHPVGCLRCSGEQHLDSRGVALRHGHCAGGDLHAARPLGSCRRSPP
jgi:hypothetical protein